VTAPSPSAVRLIPGPNSDDLFPPDHPGGPERRLLCGQSSDLGGGVAFWGSQEGSMSLSTTASRRRPARVAAAVAAAVALLAPLAVLCAQTWRSSGDLLSFTADERRGALYLAPLTRLLATATEAQSAAVRGQPVDAAAIRAAVAEVDEIDRRLGGPLGTTDRWETVRSIVQDRASRAWPDKIAAYTQFSDLGTALLALNRTVGDNSRLILDPAIDAYYVMNATLLRIPEILVDSGRYTDLSVLAASGRPDATGQAQLAAARNRVATDASDLADGLVKAFGQTDSGTLGPGLTRQLDNFRTAVDAVAPSSSLLAPTPDRSLADLAADQTVLRSAALDLQGAALDQLDRLLADRESGQRRDRVVTALATVVGVLAAATAAWLIARGPRTPAEPPAEPLVATGPDGPVEPALNGTAAPGRARLERPGGVRADR
jgi:hypothetical protein